jgi:ribosome maturation factor RimP
LLTTESLAERFQQLLVETEFELVDLKFQGGQGHIQFAVKLDHRERSIQISELEKWSRRFEEVLDISDDVPREYGLDVSSPGIDRDLSKEWEFKKNIGREFDIQTLEENEEGKINRFKAKLEKVEDNQLIFKDGQSVKIEFLKSAKVTLPW